MRSLTTYDYPSIFVNVSGHAWRAGVLHPTRKAVRSVRVCGYYGLALVTLVLVLLPLVSSFLADVAKPDDHPEPDWLQ